MSLILCMYTSMSRVMGGYIMLGMLRCQGLCEFKIILGITRCQG